VPKEYGIQRNKELHFFNEFGAFKNRWPIPRLIKKPITRVNVKRTIDKKYISHM
jgi:hypothetical protein